MDISVSSPATSPTSPTGASPAETDLGDGYTRWDWHVSYPINNYGVSLNIGNYVHFADKMPADAKLGMGELTMDYWVLPEDLDKAKVTFQQAKGMIEGLHPLLRRIPLLPRWLQARRSLYSGVEHQTAVTYGNRLRERLRRPPQDRHRHRFDFIIVHESAHEWFGNAITARDRSDMWIHEGWANYCGIPLRRVHVGQG